MSVQDLQHYLKSYGRDNSLLLFLKILKQLLAYYILNLEAIDKWAWSHFKPFLFSI